jgi:hypothetical protein
LGTVGPKPVNVSGTLTFIGCIEVASYKLLRAKIAGRNLGRSKIGRPLIWSRFRGQASDRDFVPKGLKDSARGFNPGLPITKRPALKGRQIVVVRLRLRSGARALKRFCRPFRAGLVLGKGWYQEWLGRRCRNNTAQVDSSSRAAALPLMAWIQTVLTRPFVRHFGSDGFFSDRKGAAKATAFIRPFEIDEINSLYALQQIFRFRKFLVVNPLAHRLHEQTPNRRTAGVQRNLVRERSPGKLFNLITS